MFLNCTGGQRRHRERWRRPACTSWSATRASSGSTANIHDSAYGLGIKVGLRAQVRGNRVVNLTAATADGVNVGSVGSRVEDNTISAVGQHGVNVSAAASLLSGFACRGNILANCGGYGLANTSGQPVPAAPECEWDGNAYYGNTSGNRSAVDDTATNPANAVAPYVNTLDVALPAGNDPFTNAAGGDYTLNGTATAAGQPLRRGTAAGPLNAWPGSAQAGFRDFGAIQHQDAGVTTITTFIEG